MLLLLQLLSISQLRLLLVDQVGRAENGGEHFEVVFRAVAHLLLLLTAIVVCNILSYTRSWLESGRRRWQQLEQLSPILNEALRYRVLSRRLLVVLLARRVATRRRLKRILQPGRRCRRRAGRDRR